MGVMRNAFLGLCLVSITFPVIAQRVIYKAKTFIAPRKYVEDEVPPEKKKARSYLNLCAKYSAEKQDNNTKSDSDINGMNLLPLSDFRKIDFTYFTNNTFGYHFMGYNRNKSEGRTICISINDGDFQIYDQRKALLEKTGSNTIEVVAINKDGIASGVSKFQVFIDRTPPDLTATLDGNPVDIKQEMDCSRNSKIGLNAIDKEYRLTHIFYRVKKDQAWKYYHDPIPAIQAEGMAFEIKATDVVGNESPIINLSCKEVKSK